MIHRIKIQGWSVLLVIIFLLTSCTTSSALNRDQTPIINGTATLDPLPTSTIPSPDEGLSNRVDSPESTLLPYSTPAWLSDAIIYEIFVRSFVDSDGDGIGDINGIIDQLDYIESLGVNTIWLMPIHPSPSVHGYDVTDYFSVYPDYGTLEDLQHLVDELHKRNMRIILDYVPSHLSNQHPMFQDAYKNPDSEYSDWFVWTNDNQSTYAGFAGSKEMPRFNHYNPEVVEYLSEAAAFWLDLDADGDYFDGSDGFRVDNATFPPQEFLVEFRQSVKSKSSEALLLGETWVHNPSDLNRFFEHQFDALFDFPLYELLQGNRDLNQDGLIAGKGFPVLLTSLLEEERNRFPPQSYPVRFLSNHDTNRISAEVAQDVSRMRLAISLLAIMPDPIMIYYGEEIGMPGKKGGPPYWDNYRREPMDWYASESGVGQTRWFTPDDRWNQPHDNISVEEQTNVNDSLLNYYRHVLSLRTTYPFLADRVYEIADLDSSDLGAWGIIRSDGQKAILAVYNFSPEEMTVNIQALPWPSGQLFDLLTGNQVAEITDSGTLELSLAPAEALWLTNETP